MRPDTVRTIEDQLRELRVRTAALSDAILWSRDYTDEDGVVIDGLMAASETIDLATSLYSQNHPFGEVLTRVAKSEDLPWFVRWLKKRKTP